MMKILTAAQMREVDRLTTEQYGVPSLLLMENAASRTVEAAEKRFGPAANKRALVISGPGNNGGDGATIARLMHLKGARLDLLLLGKIEGARDDARTNFEIARQMASLNAGTFRMVEVETPEQLRDAAWSVSYDIVFDAIFGTGLTRPATGIFEEAIGFVNERGRTAPVIAVDIPSGIASDSAELIGPAVRARLTVTFSAPKLASVLAPACHYGGELVVAPIGSPDRLLCEAGSDLTLVEPSMIERWLRDSRRAPEANKGDVGKVLIVAGSRGKTGAACLAGEAAMRAGAGLVTVATPATAQPITQARMAVECMTEPLAETASGAASREAVSRVLELSAERDVTALGPGLGSSDESTRAMVREVVAGRRRPLVIDADGLNCLAPWPAELRGSRELPIILTPHPGEMARLTAKPIAEVLRDRIEVAKSFAAARGVTLVLKGSRTLVAAPNGEVYVNPTGNAGMASGGTGDVLTGIIASLVGQKRDDPTGATIAAVYLHGLAGDIAASRVGTRAMIASDITRHLGEAFVEAGGPEELLSR